MAQLPTCHRRAPARSRRIWGESAVVHRWLPAQAPAYYYYTAADDSTYGYDDSAYAYGYDDAYGHAQCTKSNIVAARLRHGSITASTPSTRRQLDGVAAWSSFARFSLRDGIFAEKGLSEELSGAPDSLFDFPTGPRGEIQGLHGARS